MSVERVLGKSRVPFGSCILMYHGIPRWAAAAFERQMRFLAAFHEVVHLGSLVPPARDCDRRKVALTFDDGLLNNVTVAYPILRKLGLPATFFVCPELMERAQWLWNHEARQRLKRMEDHARIRLAHELRCASADVESFIDAMKSLAPQPRSEVQERIRACTPLFRPTAEERDSFHVASWDDIRKLDPELITIGSHTLTHPILTTLPDERLETEVAGSRRVLEQRLQRTVDLFAYPNGSQDARVLNSVRRHYRGAVLAQPYPTEPVEDPHLIPRKNAPHGVLRLARLFVHRTMTTRDPSAVSPQPICMRGSFVEVVARSRQAD